jgi:hypothetical protein
MAALIAVRAKATRKCLVLGTCGKLFSLFLLDNKEKDRLSAWNCGTNLELLHEGWMIMLCMLVPTFEKCT